MILLEGKVYICGGFNGHECLSTAESFDPLTNQWTLLEPMRNRRSGIGVIAYKGEIYALGGFNGITRMNTGEKYCPNSNRWKTIPEMFNPRSNFAIEVIEQVDFFLKIDPTEYTNFILREKKGEGAGHDFVSHLRERNSFCYKIPVN